MISEGMSGGKACFVGGDEGAVGVLWGSGCSERVGLADRIVKALGGDLRGLGGWVDEWVWVERAVGMEVRWCSGGNGWANLDG